MKIRAVIVDNDSLECRQLCDMLRFYDTFEFVEFFDNADTAYEYLCANAVDAVFIRLECSNGGHSSDGTFLAYSLSNVRPDMIVTLYSGKEKKASEIFQMNCAEFFTLPLHPTVIHRVVSRVKYRFEMLQYKRQSQDRSMMVKTNQGYQMINLDTILFIERFNRKNRMITTEGKQIMLNGYTLDELTQILSANGFYRCYQSYIINLSKVSCIRVDSVTKNYTLQFDGYAGEILLSRDKYGEIVSLLKDKYARISL